MEQKEFRELTSPEEARRIIDNVLIKPALKTLPLEDANGRILAEDIFSNIDVPAFDRSVKDGFAVKAQDTYAATEIAPVILNKMVNCSWQCARYTLASGKIIEIATGAPNQKVQML
jgi:putative molybdopterin biosynthesis protein